MGYEGATANSANVMFAYGEALQAARDLWALAGELRSHQSRRATVAQTARRVWVGPKHDQFEDKMRREASDTTAVADGLEATARAIGRSWAEARGQQDRINFARWVDKQIDDDGVLENIGEFFTGEDDYGPPPGNPDPPGPPAFPATRSPVHPEFEQVDPR
jgi:hypothetical protein